MVDFVPGRAVIDAAQRKRGKYTAKCAAIGYGFLPFSFSSLGELEADAVTLLKRFRKFSMTQDIGARAAVHIFNRISFAIAKGVGAQIVSRLPSNLLSRGGYNGNTYHPTQSHNGNRSYPVDSFCQFCEIACHHICDCMNFAKFLKDNNICVVNSSSLNAQPSPTANVTTMTSSMKQLWLFDTGASHHATYNLSSLQTYADYEGPDEILLGDGNSLSISHTGHTHINTPHRPLSLSNVLCVPRLRHNLISIAKLCKSNPASVKFFSSYFLVKYLRTWATLLRVENIDDVYSARFSSLP
ncbi:hypothetical protein Tco_0699453 [Tanacetum coccineum]